MLPSVQGGPNSRSSVQIGHEVLDTSANSASASSANHLEMLPSAQGGPRPNSRSSVQIDHEVLDTDANSASALQHAVLPESIVQGDIQSFTQNLNLQKIVELIHCHEEHSSSCIEQDTVFLLGNTGAGKSATVNYLCGRRIISVMDSKNCDERLEVEDPLEGCLVGYTGDSETRYLRGYLEPSSEDGRLVICDTPGFEDTEGCDVDIANAVAVSWAIRRSKSIRLVLLIEASIILNPRGKGLNTLLTLFQRFLPNIEDHLDSVLPLITHCQGTAARRLEAALERHLASNHLRETRSMLQLILDKLRRHPDHVLLFPADEQGEQKLPYVRALVHGLKPIIASSQVIKSPLSESSISGLVIRCKDMATSVDARFRRRLALLELKGDLDDLRLLSDALCLPSVTQCYNGICKLILDRITDALRCGRNNFELSNFVETKLNFKSIEGFDKMQVHYKDLDPDLKTREYVSLLKHINNTARRYFQSLSDPNAPFESLLGTLNHIQGIDVLKGLLEPQLRNNYRSATQMVQNRFDKAYQDAKQVLADQNMNSEHLNELLRQLHLVPHFHDHLQDRCYFEDCIQELQTKVNAAHTFVMQNLDQDLDLAASTDLGRRLALLCAAGDLDPCYAPEAGLQYSACIEKFNSVCNGLFASVDSALTGQRYGEVGHGLGQLQLFVQVRDDCTLSQRYCDKINDVSSRLESEISMIRSLLGVEIPRDQDYSTAVGKVHKFSDGLKHLAQFLPVSASDQYQDELGQIIREIECLHTQVFEKANRILGKAGSEVARTECLEDPKEFMRMLTLIEFMLSIKLEFDTGLSLHRENMKSTMMLFFNQKCKWCLEISQSMDDPGHVDELQSMLLLLKAFSDEFKKLAGRGENLPLLLSEVSPGINPSPPSSSSQAMSEAPTIPRRTRNAASLAERGLNMVRSKLNFWAVEGGPALASEPSSDSEGRVSEGTRDCLDSITLHAGMLRSTEDVNNVLEAAFSQSLENLGARATDLEASCLEQLGEANFEEVERLLIILSSFGRLESMADLTFSQHYKSAVSGAHNVLSKQSESFDALIRGDEMEKAVSIVNTIRNMLILKEHLPYVEEVYRRINSAFLEKTSQFGATMNELLESKNFLKMARLLRGHGQLETALPRTRHEFDSAQQQLAEYFRVRFEGGWSSIQSMVPSKRVADHKLSELRDVFKEFFDARPVFDNFGLNNQFTEWSDTLVRNLNVKVVNIAQHAEACVGNLDIRAYDVCINYLESIQVISVVAEIISNFISELDAKMRHKIESLEGELLAAIDRVEPRFMDKIFNGLKRGMEVNKTCGKQLDEEYERLQTIMESRLRELCCLIQKSLDEYEIKEAHKNLEKFRTLLVSEAVKGTLYNGDKLSKFQSEMDEIKQEILTPRLLTEDPEKISRCLEGFKEVDSRFYKRQRDRFLDNLKAEVTSCGQEVARRDLRNLKGLEQRMKELKYYERALKGQGCDREIEGYKRDLFDSLTDTITQVYEEIDFKVTKSKWDDVDQLKTFLSKACPILQSSELTDESVRLESMGKLDKMNSKIEAKARGITDQFELVKLFDLKNPNCITADGLVEFLSEVEREGQLLDGKLVRNFVSQDISKEKIIREIKAKVQAVTRDIESLWEARDYKLIQDIILRLEGMSRVEPFAGDVERILIRVQEDLKQKLDGQVDNCLVEFKHALKPGQMESKDAVRKRFQTANTLLEEIQRAQKYIGAFPHISAENREERVVKVMIQCTDQFFDGFQRIAGSLSGPSMEDVVGAVLNLWTVPSEVSNERVKAHATAKVAHVFELCRESGRRRKAEFNFGELAQRLAEIDAKGGEVVDQFNEIFRSYHSKKFREATARMTIDDSLDKLARLNSLTDEQKEALKRSYTDFQERFRRLLETSYTLDQLLTSLPKLEMSEGMIKGQDIPKVLAVIFAVWSRSMSSTGSESGAWPSPHPVQVLAILRLLGVGAPTAEKNFLHVLMKGISSYFKPKDAKAKAGTGHLIELKTGEGKSIVLGVLATFLAILGFRVDCVCYSQYLSNRDWNAFKGVFEVFGVQDRVKYDTFTSLSKRLINSVCDVRQGTRSFLSDEGGVSAGGGDDECHKILLIDEVDVFFSDEFYGAVYAASSVFVNAHIEAIQRLVWQQRAHPARDIVDQVKKHASYAQLSKECARVMGLIDRHISSMAEDVKLVGSKDHVYHVDKEGRIAYRTQDTVSSNVVCGYKTLFAYFQERERGAVGEEQLKAAMGLHIRCGNFSYAEIPRYYCQILGVTGTLESLGEFEKGVIKSVYGITRKTLTPSIYGDSQLTFREVSDVHVEPDAAQYNRKIKEEILAAAEQNRAVLVFFEDEVRLEQWRESGYAEGVENLCHVTSRTENIEHYVKQATRARSATLFTAVHGRGLDFVCHDKAMDAQGGVHVVQTFLSSQHSEEIQTKGRTARQGKKGTFKLVLLASDLDRFGISPAEVEEARKAGGVYPLLHGKRAAWFATESARRGEVVECARDWHARSVAYQRLLLDYSAGRPEPVANKVREALLAFEAHRAAAGGGVCRLMCLSDATGSMDALWDSSKKHITSMLRRIEELAGKGRVMLKWVAYRDYDVGRDGGLQCSEWTTDAGALVSFLDGVRCHGGGDLEEAVEAALALANRDEPAATRVLLIGDAPPHPEKAGQRLSGHSHVLETDWGKECAELRRKGVPLYTFQVGSDGKTTEVFTAMATETGGEARTLKSADDLLDVVCLQALDQVGGSALADQYRAKYMSFTFAS